jgi:excisionase family DNA binding protein
MLIESGQKPLNLKQAAAFLGLKPSYVYNLVYFGKLAVHKPGGKLLYFKQADLEAYAFQNRKAADFELAEQADEILTGKGTEWK